MFFFSEEKGALFPYCVPCFLTLHCVWIINAIYNISVIFLVTAISKFGISIVVPNLAKIELLIIPQTNSSPSPLMAALFCVTQADTFDIILYCTVFHIPPTFLLGLPSKYIWNLTSFHHPTVTILCKPPLSHC